MKYEVIVGNLGTVQRTDSSQAYFAYNFWVGESKWGHGRAQGESVTLMRDGEPVKEYAGTLDREENGDDGDAAAPAAPAAFPTLAKLAALAAPATRAAIAKMEAPAAHTPDAHTPDAQPTPATPADIAKARELYADDDIAIDDDARLSVAEGGAWVSAWVWIGDPEGGQRAMLLISQTFERYDPHEPEEDVCEPDESGFTFERRAFTLIELSRYIRHMFFNEPSCTVRHAGDIGPHVWLSTTDDTPDFRTGVRMRYSLHFAHGNTPHAVRYWRAAVAHALRIPAQPKGGA